MTFAVYHTPTNPYSFHPLLPRPAQNTNLGLERVGELLEVVLDGAVLGEELDVGTVHLDLAGIPPLNVLLAAEGGEAPVLGDDDLLPAGELVLGAAEGLEGVGAVWEGLLVTVVDVTAAEEMPVPAAGGRERLTRVTSAERHEDLANVDTGDKTVGLAESATHSGLEPIGSGTRQHLVDADDVEGVSADAEVEAVLATVLHHEPGDSRLESRIARRHV
jgi:hypothetical protein